MVLSVVKTVSNCAPNVSNGTDEPQGRITVVVATYHMRKAT